MDWTQLQAPSAISSPFVLTRLTGHHGWRCLPTLPRRNSLAPMVSPMGGACECLWRLKMEICASPVGLLQISSYSSYSSLWCPASLCSCCCSAHSVLFAWGAEPALDTAAGSAAAAAAVGMETR